MRAMTLALAALTMLGPPAAFTAPALADGIERPQAPAPARPRPRPAEPAPPPPVIQESAPVPLYTAPPPPPPPPSSNELHLSDAFFMAPLAGGVGYGIGESAYAYASARVSISGGQATFSGAGRDLSMFRSHSGGHGGGHGGSCRRC